MKDFVTYVAMKKDLQELIRDSTGKPFILKIKKLNELYPSEHLDWLQLINSQLLNDSQKTLNDKILI